MNWLWADQAELHAMAVAVYPSFHRQQKAQAADIRIRRFMQ